MTRDLTNRSHGWKEKALTTAGPALATDHVADTRFSVALTDVFGFLIVEAELVFVESFDRNFYGALSIGEDDGFVGNDRAEVFTYRFLDAILVALLIDDALALK